MVNFQEHGVFLARFAPGFGHHTADVNFQLLDRISRSVGCFLDQIKIDLSGLQESEPGVALYGIQFN